MLVRLDFKSPHHPTLSNRNACDRPAGGVLTLTTFQRIALIRSFSSFSDVERVNSSTHPAGGVDGNALQTPQGE
jgi:hypothetical protein